MKEIKTIEQFIDHMWNSGQFEDDKTIKNIQNISNSKGYTFDKKVIRSALEQSEVIVRSGKMKNRVPLYRQAHPPPCVQKNSADSLYNQIFDSLSLHIEIKKISEKLFKDEHYSESISAAYKKINNMVKEKSEETWKDGKNLMLSTFSVKSPILKINKLETQSEKDEQEGFMYIFAGVMHGIRNPRAHDELSDSPQETIELLCMASILARIIDKTSK